MWLINQGGTIAYNADCLQEMVVDGKQILARNREGKIIVLGEYESQDEAKKRLNAFIDCQ